MNLWWYSVNESRKGPVSVDALRTLLLDKKITKDTMVWKEGLSAWSKLADLEELAGVVSAVPPDLPRVEPDSRAQLIELPLAGPWRRFFARFIDIWVIGLPLGFLVSYLLSRVSLDFGLWIQKPGSEYMFGWLLVPFVLLVEGVQFSIFGTTFGKSLLGLKVITNEAVRPTAVQYFKRLVGVYWYGLGSAFPFVPLFTMARQYGRLKSDKPAGYDEGNFSVKAKRLSAFRIFLVVVVGFLILMMNGVLSQINQSIDTKIYSGSTWVNAVTGRTVAIPAGWISESKVNEEKQPIYMFTGPEYGAFVIFAKEDVGDSYDLQLYTSVWTSAVKKDMLMSLPGTSLQVNGREAISLSGHVKDDRTQRVHATILQKGRQMWRVVILTTSGRDPNSEATLKLQRLLFDSVD